MIKKTERVIKKQAPVSVMTGAEMPETDMPLAPQERAEAAEKEAPQKKDVSASQKEGLRRLIPAKFIDAETGEMKTEELIKSYLALEKRFSERCQTPSGIRPEAPDAYQINLKNDLLKRDPDMEKKLFDLGFTNEQVQAVYDLAAEKVIPILESLSDDVRTEKELAALEREFGGPEQFNQIGRQISAWAEKHLNPEIFDVLASSKDGILALYQMMQERNETPLLSEREPAPRADTEETLRRLMQDPAYWRQHDPKLVKRVEEGFKRLYG